MVNLLELDRQLKELIKLNEERMERLKSKRVAEYEYDEQVDEMDWE